MTSFKAKFQFQARRNLTDYRIHSSLKTPILSYTPWSPLENKVKGLMKALYFTHLKEYRDGDIQNNSQLAHVISNDI